jgi:hypothetical protein
MVPEAALRPRPEVVRETEGGDRGHGRVRAKAQRPADERQAQAPVVDCEGPARKHCVEQLSRPVDKAPEVAAGHLV